jgi:chromosome segregation ATPase
VKRARLQAALALATLSFGSFFGVLGSSKPALAAGPDPAAEAQRLVTLLDTPATRTIVADPLAKAKAAQQRAQSARGAGDLHHATELDALALTWAQVADDLLRTASAEKKLSDLQKQVADLEQKAVRTQALIEQTIARRGRAEQNLNNAEVAKPAAKAAASKPAAASASKDSAPSKASKPGGQK